MRTELFNRIFPEAEPFSLTDPFPRKMYAPAAFPPLCPDNMHNFITSVASNGETIMACNGCGTVLQFRDASPDAR